MVKKRNVLPRVVDPLDMNRFHWKCTFFIHEELRKISDMLHEGVEKGFNHEFSVTSSRPSSLPDVKMFRFLVSSQD